MNVRLDAGLESRCLQFRRVEVSRLEVVAGVLGRERHQVMVAATAERMDSQPNSAASKSFCQAS